MQLKGVTATKIKATHETPKAHYIDDLTFTVQANSTSKLCNMQVSQTSTLSLKIALFREHNVHSFCYFGFAHSCNLIGSCMSCKHDMLPVVSKKRAWFLACKKNIWLRRWCIFIWHSKIIMYVSHSCDIACRTPTSVEEIEAWLLALRI